MTLAIRFLTKAKYPVLTANGRQYPTGGATVIDIPFNDGIAIDPGMVAQLLMVVGASSERPVYNPDIGGVPTPVMYDTTLSKVIFWAVGSYPAVWVDITGATV
jgi:hypothetical protein